MEQKEKIITLRFKPDTVSEIDLFNRIEQAREKEGVSMPEFVKSLLTAYFDEQKQKSDQESFLTELRTLQRENVKHIEQVVRSCMIEHNAALIGALAKLVSVPTGSNPEPIASTVEATLPAESSELPQEAEGILDMFE